jgi:hypothetical protein
MARRRTRGRRAGRTSVHVNLDADLVARAKAMAGWQGRPLGELVAEGLRTVLRGFSVRIEPQICEGNPADGRGGDNGVAA